LSLLDLEQNPDKSRRRALDAENRLLASGPEQILSGSDLVSLAMARCLQGEPRDALRTLESAEKLGENTAYRFEKHQQLAFQSIAADPDLSRRLRELIVRVRENLTID
jgi:hypothetical protein